MRDAAITHLQRGERTAEIQRAQLDFIQKGNRTYQKPFATDSRLDARIESFEIAFRMKMETSGELDVSNETPHALAADGIGGGPTDNFCRQCLLVPRLVERGVRFVQCSPSYQWDQHDNLKSGPESNAKQVDQPITALIRDLKTRGLLDSSLILLGTEF